MIDDGGKQSPWVKAEIVVNPVSDSPVAGDVNLVGHEDQELKLYGWHFDDNADYALSGSKPNAAQQVKIVDLPSNGNIYHNGVVVSSAGYLIPWEDAQSWGKVTFKPTDDWNGTTSFHYAVVDDSGAESAAAVFTVSIEPVNDVPSAQGFSETGSEDTVIVIDGWNIDDSRDQVTGGSSADPPDSVTILSLPEHGTLYHNGTAVVTTGHVVSWADASGGTVTFQALQDWNGTDSFFWAVTDTAGNQVEGMGASLVVNPVNDAHTIYDTEMEGYSGEKIWLSSHLLAFDDQRDEILSGSHANQPASLTIVDLPAFGTLYFNDIVITAPGLSVPWAEADRVYFLCTDAQVGSTFFHCDVIDETGQDAMGSATVSISASISGSYDSEFTIFTEQGTEETAVVIDSWGSYAGGSGATPAWVTINSLPLNGTLSHNGVAITATGYAIPWSDATSGTVTFSPDQHWNGVAYIAFTFVDSGGAAISSSSVVVVTVVPVNDPAVAGNFSESGLEDTTLVVNGWVYDDSIDKVPLGSEPQNPALIRITSVPENGTLFHGINPINTANYAISWNDAVTGSVTFLGQDNWNGETSFAYIIVDETGLAGSAGTATLIITPDFGGAAQFSEVGNEDTVIAVDGWRFEPPAGGVSPVSIRIDTLPYEGYGSLYYNGSLIGSNHFDVSWADAVSSTVTFVPTDNWNGNTSFCYSVLDSTGTRTSSVEATITVTPVDDPHTISDYVARGLEDLSVSLWPVQNRYFDIDGDKPVSLTIVSLPANGTLKSVDSAVVQGQELSWAQVSSLKFHGDLDWFGTTTFQYTATDSSGWTTAQPATVSITLEDTHDFPRALSFTESGNQGDNVVIDSWGAASGEGGYASVRLYSLTMYNGQLFHNGVPIVTEGYEIPWSEAVGSLVTYRSSHPQSLGSGFLFTVVDGTGQESLFAVAKIELTPVDDPLQIISDAKFFGSQDQVTAVEWYLGYSDPDLYSEGTTDEPVYLKILTRPPSSEGNLYLNGWLITSDGVQIPWPEAQDGSVEFMPSHNWFGTTTFTYKLIDGKGRESSNTGTATISIMSVDDPTEIKGPGTWWVQYAKPGIPLTFSTANDNEVYLEDPDGDNPQVSVTLEANAETAVLTLGSTSNVTAWSELDGRKWTVQGDLADVNNALEEFTYTVNLKSTAGLEEVYFGDVNRIDIRVTNLDGAYCDGESIDVGIVPAQMYDGHVYWEYVESSEYDWYWADNAGFTDAKVFKGEIEYRPDEGGPLQTWDGSKWIAMNGGLWFRDEGLYTYRSTSADFITSLHDGIGYDGEPVTRTQVGWDPSMNAYLYTADGVYSGQQLLKWYVRDPGSDSASDIRALFVEYSPAQQNTAHRPNYLKAEITAPMVNVVFYDPSSYTLEEWAKDVQLLSYVEGTPGQNTFIDTLGIWAHGYTNQFDVGLDIITYGTSGVGGDSNQMYFYCWDDPYVRDNFKEIGEVLNGTDSQIQIWECSVAGNNDFDPDHQARRMLRGIAWHSGATVCASSDLTCIWPEGWAGPTDRNTPSVPEWEEEPDDGEADDPVEITGAFLSFAKPGDLCDYQLEYLTTADAKMDGSAMREGMWSFDKLKSGGRDVGPYLNESSSSDELAGWLPWEHTRF